MKKILIFLVFILGLLYIISPIDFLPDGFPVIGWLDDIFIGWVLGYYLAYGRLPGFVSRFFSGLFGKKAVPGADRRSTLDGDGAWAEEDPYAVLGVSRNASDDEIRKAYKIAVQQYHPDKVAHLGPEFKELAEKKFIRIQAAYEFLMKTG